MPHVSVSKLSPGDESGTAAVAAYYTQTIEARTVEMTMEDFGRVIGYYGAGHEHDDSVRRRRAVTHSNSRGD